MKSSPVLIRLHKLVPALPPADAADIADNLMEFITPRAFFLLSDNTLRFMIQQYLTKNVAPTQTLLIPIMALTNINESTLQSGYGELMMDSIHFNASSPDLELSQKAVH